MLDLLGNPVGEPVGELGVQPGDVLVGRGGPEGVREPPGELVDPGDGPARIESVLLGERRVG